MPIENCYIKILEIYHVYNQDFFNSHIQWTFSSQQKIILFPL